MKPNICMCCRCGHCGVHAPSAGTVLCGDASELDAKHDITTIQSAMGVCTQDNLLWGELTGPEHLGFFARMRRVAPALRTKQIDYWLKRVNLHSRADRRKRTRAYSGGMKRRLSVANAYAVFARLYELKSLMRRSAAAARVENRRSSL